ncbi:2-keto-3-deoxy-galactonokinase [Sulfitobacter sp. THAF37]|uniref:2-dehydro-3-deoxygalactonokinase n=1 Tax=Sulfitobacter sp. THAF37 TaxID=2587855 RepID=UPI0012681560|nr:2-dehydro-3-deoxygalactonokinase [Sulfitobacter sp. THAF37]QFT59589.1 2-keto-3-deoxy-galactonokinase [Sulfitobacter sp. THAF37]
MTENNIKPDWIAVDAGAEGMSAWAMQGGHAVGQMESTSGLGDGTGLAAALDDLTAGWHLTEGTVVVICGPVEGTVDALRPVPCPPLPDALSPVPYRGWAIHAVPGLSRQTPADITQGAETRIAGFLALNPGWDGVICLTGPTSIWAEVSAGEVVSFQSFISGEMIGLLAAGSAQADAATPDSMDMAAFGAAVSDSLSRPERIAAHLSSARAGEMRGTAPPGTGRARVSGLLIGAELAAARPYWLGQNLALIGASADTRLYAAALEAQGAAATVAEAQRMALAGLTTAHRLIRS